MTDPTRFKTGGGVELAAGVSEPSPEQPRKGQEVNGYLLQSMLGKGGMGVVYEATRIDGEIDRTVAIKLVSSNIEPERFQRERQLHAQLSHPNIARMYDAGTTPDGEPFLVMELIEGHPIDEFCLDQKLPLRQRVEILEKVVLAVAHAHANLIIHRDIKPSNVLVDTQGEPKLLDFGIAKPLESDAGDLTRDARPLTPNYASPEQLLGMSVSIASDVYQLGVLIAQVCAGQPTFADRSLPGAIARAKRTSPDISPEVANSLPPDLLAIVSKALQPNVADRYVDANALAAELNRFIHGFPVLAKNPGVVSKTIKLVRRHPLASLATIATLVTAAFGNWWYTSQLSQSRDQAQLASQTAEKEAAKSGQVTQFLVGLFERSDPMVSNGLDLTAKEILERGLNDIDDLADQPDIQNELLLTVGKVYVSLASLDEARVLFERVRDQSDDPLVLLRAATGLGGVMRDRGEYDEALTMLADGLSALDAENAGHREKFDARRELALLYGELGQYDEALAQIEVLLESRQHVTPDAVVPVLLEKATIVNEMGDWQRAESIFKAAIELETTENGPESARLGSIYNNLGIRYLDRSENEQAEAAFQKAFDVLQTAYGPEHPMTANALGNLANVYLRWERYDQALEMLERTTEIHVAIHGPNHPNAARGYGIMGMLYLDLEQYKKAQEMLERTYEIFSASFDPDSAELGTARNMLGKVHAAQENYSEAERWLREVVEIRARTLPPDNLALLDSAVSLIETLRAQNKHAEADEIEDRYDFAPYHAALAQYADDESEEGAEE